MSDYVQAAKIGFDCDFVQAPPAGLDCYCPTCSKILREPYQAICCGRSLCHQCILESESSGKPCPVCEAVQDFNIFPNTGLKKRLYGLDVYCTHKSEGCSWKGELGRLDRHLNVSPAGENHLSGCDYVMILCPFFYAGCDTRLVRKDMTRHLEDAFIQHQLKQAARQAVLMQAVGTLQEEKQALKMENAQLKVTVDKQQGFIQYREQQIDEMQLKLDRMEREREMASRTGMAVGPVRFIMEGFELHKATLDDNWFTPHFWTHPHGYKVCLCVVANGEGPAQGNYTSILIHMMRGEFDEQLAWPFRGIITVQLIDQEKGEEHYSKEVHITQRTPDEVADRVMKGERTKKGWGLFQFIQHSELTPKYLKNDRLVFQIGQIKLTRKV